MFWRDGANELRLRLVVFVSKRDWLALRQLLKEEPQPPKQTGEELYLEDTILAFLTIR